jgi:hypothetical protein
MVHMMCLILSLFEQHLTSETRDTLTSNRDQQSMGNRYLEVFHGKRSEYYAAVASVSLSFLYI